MKRTISLAAGFGAAALTAMAATPAAAIDFSCREATQTAERTICSDARLGKLDDRMATVYGKLWSVSGFRSRLALRDEQHRFLNARNSCGRDTRCIRDAYLDQISVLDSKLADAGGH
jgi:uncharacterized protein